LYYEEEIPYQVPVALVSPAMGSNGGCWIAYRQ